MLEKIKFYIMLKKSCHDFSDEELEDLLFEFDVNYTSLEEQIIDVKNHLEESKKLKKENSSLLFAPDVDSAIVNYYRATESIYCDNKNISALKIAKKDNTFAKKMIRKTLKRRNNDAL